MKIRVFGKTVQIEQGQVHCEDPYVQDQLASWASASGFTFGQYFPSLAARDNFIGQALARRYEGQVLALDPLPPAELLPADAVH
ncbi:MAG: hypothetical protein ACAI44_39780 [Candidatus Sericytochromatia bacterium]